MTSARRWSACPKRARWKTVVRTTTHSMAAAMGLLLLAITSPAPAATECKWFGTAPLCDGSCPSGWELKSFSSKGCIGTWGISGTKTLCCKPPPKCEYGTPGCPYPPFSRRKIPKPKPIGPNEDCGKRMYKGGDGQCYPILN